MTNSENEIFNKAKKVMDLLSKKILEDEKKLDKDFPYVTKPDGSWDTLPASLSAGYDGDKWSHGNWFGGFWVGLLLASYLHTKNENYKKLAEKRLDLIRDRSNDQNTHDIGFIFYSSAKVYNHIFNDKNSIDIGLTAANNLRKRSITTHLGSYISSWGPHSDERGRKSSAIDTMANIPLLYWAADKSNDESFKSIALSHADMTLKSFVRDDMSTCHAVEYDLPSGNVSKRYTFQGYGDDSNWSRGQAWAIYGCVSSFINSNDYKYIQQADDLINCWFKKNEKNFVPPWDFDDPNNLIKDKKVYDSSAAAIVASALLDISKCYKDEGKNKLRKEQAIKTIENLCDNFVAYEEEHRGILKHSCYSHPHKIGVDSAVMFGDFYFIEALCTLLMPGKFK